MGEQIFQGAPLADQLRRPFDANSLDPGNVVAGVADQRAQVEHLVRRHAKFFDHFCRAKAAVFDAVDQLDPVRAQLHQVLVRRDDRNQNVVWSRANQGGDHIVRFEARYFNAWNLKRIDQVAYDRELHRQVFGSGVAVGLVLGIHLVAKRSPLWIHCNDDEIRRLVPDEFVQDVCKTEHGVARGAVRRAQARDAEEGAKNRVGPVDHHEASLFLGLRLFRRFCGLSFCALAFRCHVAPRLVLSSGLGTGDSYDSG